MIVGDYACGKSSWARTLGSHVYFRNLYDLEEWDPEASYVVFDDIWIDFVHAVKQWVSAQGEFTDTDKYRKKRRIRWGPRKCCIILCNRGSKSDWRYSDVWKNDQEWFDQAIKVIELDRHQLLY